MLVLNDSTMRAIVLGRKLLRAPWRRREPTSSSSKRAARVMMLLSDLVEEGFASEEEGEEAAMRASMAAKEHTLSSMRPAKMNSLSRPPSCAGWVSKTSRSQFMMLSSV